ncbi:MAG: hypothetical protein AAF491_06275 [Verrucomicrobiota bacterium]
MSLSGCRSTDDKEKEEGPASVGAEPTMMVPVGTVHVIRAEENFVLVRSSRFLGVESGTDLVAYRNGSVESARLRVSPARKGQFITADILSGSPEVGDQVLMNYSPTQRTPSGPAGQPSGGDEIQVLE